MHAACLQQKIEPCCAKANLNRALRMADIALKGGAEILVYPELFLTGFCYKASLEDIDLPTYPILDRFRTIVREHDCLIIGSIRSDRQNLGFCLDRDGLELRAKIHPFGEEKEHFDGGNFISPIATRWGMIGLQVCYDLRFPEVARSLALQGADYLVTVAQFPENRRLQWQTLAQARAIENQMPHLACNWAGAGNSMIINARGEVEAKADADETIVFGNIDLAKRDIVRREIPCFADRRPDIY